MLKRYDANGGCNEVAAAAHKRLGGYRVLGVRDGNVANIFGRQRKTMAWVKAASVTEMTPGVGKTVSVNGRELALFLVDGQFYCIDNVCPHMAGPLSEGDLEGEIVYCPWHYWPVNVRTGEVTYDPGLCADTFPCRVEDGSVFVDVG